MKNIKPKILILIGTRPEAIKMAPVIHALRKGNAHFIICITGQHREMLDIMLSFFEIEPHYDLNLMHANQSINELSASMLNAINKILMEERPELVLVQGDTTTAFIGALASSNLEIKVGHIEAGLRTFNRSAPFPEEINRQLISRIATFHFAPTDLAFSNLINEGINEKSIFLTGNTIVDAVEWARLKMQKMAEFEEIIQFKKILDPLKKIILVTGHRRENFNGGITQICEALIELVQRTNSQVIFPVHLNPVLKENVFSILEDKSHIHLIPPVSYPGMIWLIENSDLLISDSGGIQEETPSFGKNLLVTRESTERPEGIEAGYNILTGANKEKIINEAIHLIENPQDNSLKTNPFGDGESGNRIVKIILEACSL